MTIEATISRTGQIPTIQGNRKFLEIQHFALDPQKNRWLPGERQKVFAGLSIY